MDLSNATETLFTNHKDDMAFAHGITRRNGVHPGIWFELDR
jgi:hypothetical protein